MAAVLAVAAVIFCGVFYGTYVMLGKIDGIPMISAPLKSYLLMMVFLSFFGMLVMSAMVSSLSTLFTSKDLPLLFSMPVAHISIFAAKFAETSFYSVSSAYFIFLSVLTAFAFSYGAQWHVILFAAALATPFFYIAPPAIGCFMSLAVSRLFPVNRARRLLYYFLIFAIAILVVLFRALEPEKLISPDKFETMARYIMSLNSPHFDKVPSTWASNMVKDVMTGEYSGFLRDFAMAYGFAFLSLAVCFATGYFVYRDCYMKYQEEQEGKDAGKNGSRLLAPLRNAVSASYGAFIGLFPRDIGTMLDKDVKTFFRTNVLVVQIIMMGAVTAFYLYNVTLLPTATSKLQQDIMDMFGFLNIGMVAFVVSAYAIRFVFPIFSLEGKAFYIIRTAPVDVRRVLSLKFFSNLVPMMIFGMFLCVASNYLMHIRKAIFALSVFDTVVLTWAICHLNVYVGVAFPALDASISEIPASFGGIVAMVSSVGYIGILLAYESMFFILDFLWMHRGVAYWYEYLGIAVATLVMAAATIAIYYVPRFFANRRIANFYEEFRV